MTRPLEEKQTTDVCLWCCFSVWWILNYRNSAAPRGRGGAFLTLMPWWLFVFIVCVCVCVCVFSYSLYVSVMKQESRENSESVWYGRVLLRRRNLFWLQLWALKQNTHLKAAQETKYVTSTAHTDMRFLRPTTIAMLQSKKILKNQCTKQ